MIKIKEFFKAESAPTRDAGMVAAALIIASAISVFLIYSVSLNALRKEFHSYLLNTAKLEASLINGDEHKKLVKPEDEASVAYIKGVATLDKFRRSNPHFAYVYTMTRKGNEIFFVLDATPEEQDRDKDGESDKSHLMDSYTKTITPKENAENLEAFDKGVADVDVDKPSTDPWGVFVTSYAPIRDSRGEMVGLACLDYDMKDYLAEIGIMKTRALMGFGAGVVISLFMAALTYRLRKRNEAVMEKLADSEHSLQRLIASVPGGVFRFRVDKDFTVNYISKAVKEITGCCPDMFRDSLKTLSALILPEDMRLVEKARTASPYVVEYRVITPEGRVVWIEERGRRAGDFLEGILLDVTGTKATESMLKSAMARVKASRQEAEKNLERYELAVNGTSDGIWDWDIEGNIIHYSPTFHRLLGYEDGELEKVSILESLLHPEDCKKVLEKASEHFRGETDSFDTEARLCCKNEEYKWFRIRGKALLDASGKPARVAGAISDIAEQMKYREDIENSRNFLKGIIEYVPDPIFVRDSEGRVIDCNAAFLDMAALSRQEALGRSYAGMFSEEDGERAVGILEEGEVRTTLVNPRGERICAAIRQSVFLDHNGKRVLVGIIRDMTSAQNAQEQVLRYAGKLERRAKELEKTKEAALATSRSKSEFLANMSHELRTPMNSIMGMAEMMLYYSQLTPKQRDWVETVLTSSRHMMRIIDDVLDFSRVEAGKLSLNQSRFNLRTAITTSMDIVAVRAREKMLELDFEWQEGMPEYYMGDEARVRQVVINLLGNAIKFTSSGFVKVSAKAEKMMGGDYVVEIEVEDSGIGIREEKLEAIFEEFVQADRSTMLKYGGTGLGLALSRRLAKMMGGDIHARSQYGRGSAFTLSVPMRAAVERVRGEG